MTFLDLPAREGPNYERAFGLRPDVYQAWLGLNGAIKTDSDLRLYELATLAAAQALRSSYCSLAHASVLLRDHLSADELQAALAGGVEPEVARLAEQVVRDATSITQADIDRVRDAGLSDREIFEVILAAAARCFFSKVLDAVGMQPDASYAEMEPELRDALVVGRPIQQA